MASNFDFDDLEEIIPATESSDPFADLGGLAGEAFHQGGRRGPARDNGAIVVETCLRCGGSGRYGTYRTLGPCYSCKGTGKRQYKQDYATRTKARTQAADRKVRKIEAWAEQHADVVAWVQRRSTGDRPFGFAVELAAKLAQYGDLNDGAVAAVRRMIVKDAARDAERAAERAQARASAPVVSVEPVIAAFAKRRAAAEEKAKEKLGGEADRAVFKAILRLGVEGPNPDKPKEGSQTFTVKTAKATSANPGALYVYRTDADRTYLGKLHEGRFQKAFVCTPVEQDAIVQACADPAKSAVAYGNLTSSCSICGKALEVGESIARGIGPKCAAKWGF